MSIRSLFSSPRLCALAIATIISAPALLASTITETFDSDPLTRGWEIHNDASLFVWNSANQNLEVTWDSSKTNSYFRLPIPVMTSEQDFSVSLDLQMHEIEIGTTEGRPSTFQFAFGFHHRAQADATNFFRGTGADTPNLAEFNFMPDSGFGPTLWPAMFSTNGLMNYSGASDFGLVEIPVDVPMRVTLSYTSADHTLQIHVQTNGVTLGEIVRAPLIETNIHMGFVLDAFSISSYSDEGQFPSEFEGSIFARGTIDNIELTLPGSSAFRATGALVAGKWEQTIVGSSGWFYTLQASSDFKNWADVSAEVEGADAAMTLSPSEPETDVLRFFRVKAVQK
jgi:hypothetical protein